jgi:hypothetical protein
MPPLCLAMLPSPLHFALSFPPSDHVHVSRARLQRRGHFDALEFNLLIPRQPGCVPEIVFVHEDFGAALGRDDESQASLAVEKFDGAGLPRRRGGPIFHTPRMFQV